MVGGLYCFRSSDEVTTETLDMAIANPAIIGSRINGYPNNM
ncbi:MAG: hypothetical protein ACXAB7_02850 [Candidatus Kariarchaeaceae archaeon]|jgi:hypothetical protein